MKFKNLRRQILVNLGNRWREADTIQSFDLIAIQSEFADIPERDFRFSIQSLEGDGLIELSHGGQSIRLTHKGLNHLRFIYTENNNEEIIVAEKLT